MILEGSRDRSVAEPGSCQFEIVRIRASASMHAQLLTGTGMERQRWENNCSTQNRSAGLLARYESAC